MKQTEIQSLLPVVFQRTLRPGNPLEALLGVMEVLHQRPEKILADLPAYFDAQRTPDTFVPFLAGWVDLDWIVAGSDEPFPADVSPMPSGVGRLRQLVAEGAFLSKWRGTAKGLLRFLETATGVSGFAIDEAAEDESGRVIPFHLRIVVPRDAVSYLPMIRRIVESQKPAYVTYELQHDQEVDEQVPVTLPEEAPARVEPESPSV